MKKKYPFPLQFLLILLVAATPQVAYAQGTSFAYRGQLEDGALPANGNYDFLVAVHDTETGGIALGPPVRMDALPVTAGQFVARLDFGAGVFTGPSRWLQIAVRKTGRAEAHTILSPRQMLMPTPYALHAETASRVLDAAVGATHLKTAGIAPAQGQFLSYDGANLLWRAPASATGFALNGKDAFYTEGNVGIGTNSPTTGYKLDVAGSTILRPSNGSIQFGSPNGELGLSMIPNATDSRADLRFDGLVLKLVAAPGRVPPSAANGLAITTAGNVGIGTNLPTAGYKLEVAGSTLLRPANGSIQFGSPNSELGLSITPNATETRADLRFDGSVLKLVAAGGRVPPSAANGLAITTAGDVGIGTTTPGSKLEIAAQDGLAIRGFQPFLSLYDSGSFFTAPARIQNAGGSIHFTPGDGLFGLGRNPTLSVKRGSVLVQGDATQSRQAGGFVKAMASIDPFLPADRYIVRCYNSQQEALPSSVRPCGFTVQREIRGVYRIDFGFAVADRFISLTTRRSSTGEPGGEGFVSEATGNQVVVHFGLSPLSSFDSAFDIIVY